MPNRIQRQRTKGWKMPEGAVYVGRPTMWGNPFGDLPLFVLVDGELSKVRGRAMFAADAFRLWLSGDLILSRQIEGLAARRRRILYHIHELAGKDLACWCRELMPCHADVLLELVNRDA